jgi:CheY-like chemotaxis protein
MIKVLIAEDNAVNRELLRELLEARGYTVFEACDGQEALHMIEQAQPELLLLDIGMPVLDGFAVIRRIRGNPRLALLPVVAVTAYAMQGDREKILNSGFDGYLSKPLNSSSLTEELDRLLPKGSQPTNPDQARKGQPGEKGRAAGQGAAAPNQSTNRVRPRP